jgi:hypothetical protein
MPADSEKVNGFLRRLWSRLHGSWVSDVPAQIAICEFECRKDQCMNNEWDSCEHRMARCAGEPPLDGKT